jgi:hypothetical protein
VTYNKDKMNTELKVVFRDVQELATLALDLEDNTVGGTQDAKMYHSGKQFTLENAIKRVKELYDN